VKDRLYWGREREKIERKKGEGARPLDFKTIKEE